MILRKPYAILIKNFKLIHVILTACMTYLLYKTWNIMSFFTDYFNHGGSVIEANTADALIGFGCYFVAFFILIGLAIVSVLMFMKKKPLTYYIYSILTYVVIIVIFIVTKNTLITMEGQLVSARISRAMSDFVNIAFILQVIATVLTFIRATGFDIKKFNFVKDLEELDIEVEDNEEFEVDVQVDTDRATRDLRRRLRHMKYVYVENKLIINIVGGVAFVFLTLFILLQVGVFDKKYTQGKFFYTSQFRLNVSNAYKVNTDYKGKAIKYDKQLVVLEVNAKKLYEPSEKLEMAKFELNIGNNHYYPIQRYNTELKDLGNVYNDEKIPTKTDKTYLLVYEVPEKMMDKKMTLRYINGISSKNKKIDAIYINVKLNPSNLLSMPKAKSFKLGDTMNMKDSVLKDSALRITGFDVKNEYKLAYEYCVTSKECVNSIEYVKPDVLSNERKALLKLTGTFKVDDKIQLKSVKNIYQLIHMFGEIHYEVGGVKKISKVKLKEVKPRNKKTMGDTYIEVTSEMLTAEKISLHFQIRNQEYIYQLK